VKKFFLTAFVTLLMTLAMAGVASACTFFLYQPELPEN